MKLYTDQMSNCFLLLTLLPPNVWTFIFSPLNNSDTSYLELAQSIQVKGSVAQDCLPVHMAIQSDLYSQPTGIDQGFPNPPPAFAFDNLLEWLTELRKTL